jgi:hypothetical protein
VDLRFWYFRLEAEKEVEEVAVGHHFGTEGEEEEEEEVEADVQRSL